MATVVQEAREALSAFAVVAENALLMAVKIKTCAWSAYKATRQMHMRVSLIMHV
jgi:hypothetical protein